MYCSYGTVPDIAGYVWTILPQRPIALSMVGWDLCKSSKTCWSKLLTFDF